MQEYVIPFIVICAIAALAVVFYVIRRIARIARKAEGLIDEIDLAQAAAETTPRSLTSIENLLLPQVLKDFPEYNAAVAAERVSADARLYYESAAAGEVLFTDGVSAALKESMILPDDVAGSIVVHKVALCAYDKRQRDRVLTYQAAVKYDDRRGKPNQVRLTLKYIAAYTDDLANEIDVIKCPNCGAPVPAVGDKVCRYCGVSLRVNAGLGWVLIDLKQD